MNRFSIQKLTLFLTLLTLSAGNLSAHDEALPNIATSTATDFTVVAKDAIPSVVSIKVQTKQQVNSDGMDFGSNPFFNDDFLQQFFGIPNSSSAERSQPVIGQGSGFIVSTDGYILTNNHVVKDATNILVTLTDGREFEGKVIGTDPYTDIAVVKIDAKNLPALKLANSDNIQVGQWAIAIGNPFGLQASLTVGVISAKGRNNLDIAREENFIQTDAAINRGNSGGPLLDIQGNVIGINTAIATNTSGGYMGIGFAIPSNMAKGVMDQLIATGTVTRGFLGISLQKIDKDLAQAFNLENTKGGLIADVSKGSPAEKAGLKQGDVVIKMNGHPIDGISNFRNEVAMTKPGTQITLTVMRNKALMDIPLVVGTYSDGQTASSETSNSLGITVQNLTPEIAQNLNYQNDQGVVISKVDPQSIAAIAGIKKGSLIVAVNHQKVASVEEFHSALGTSDKGKPVLFLIKQGQVMRYISLKTE